MENITGQRIRELRTEKGITQSELADMFDKTCSCPRMWELGKSMPDAATIKKLAAFFGCSSDYLLDISDFKTEEERLSFGQIEQTMLDGLHRLRERDRMLLVASLNQFISGYKDLEDDKVLDFEPLSSLIESLALMLAEIKTARTREAGVDGVLCFGELKCSAESSLDSIYRQLLTVYLKLLKD